MMNSDDGIMTLEYERCRGRVDDRLESYFTGEYAYRTLLESIRYSLLAGGKRIRAVMCIKFCEAAGGTVEKSLDAACAIEMLHTYSLIHDDLPCMDDDELRRGKPSNHVMFGESTAMLAGDALQAAAFETLLNTNSQPCTVVEMGRILAEAAGAHGICGGQYLDLSCKEEKLTPDALGVMHKMKTAALISASARMGVAAAGGTQEQKKAAGEYATALGLAFQVRDDVLDCTAAEDELGKPTGSDMKKGKMTFAALMKPDECEDLIRAETEKAIKALDGIFGDAEFLIWFARMLAARKY